MFCNFNSKLLFLIFIINIRILWFMTGFSWIKWFLRLHWIFPFFFCNYFFIFLRTYKLFIYKIYVLKIVKAKYFIRYNFFNFIYYFFQFLLQLMNNNIISWNVIKLIKRVQIFRYRIVWVDKVIYFSFYFVKMIA